MPGGGDMTGPGTACYNVDLSHAVEIAPRVWWVGVIEDGMLQCHAYLIEQEENSVLIDAGSKLTFPKILGKINEVVPFNSIRYFIFHHEASYVAGALPLIDQLVFRRDVCVVTHGLAKDSLRHYDCQLPWFFIEENGWQLTLHDRILEFCFTPYAPSAGSFITYDPVTRVMFTSDIFACFTDSSLPFFARELSFIEEMKTFHQSHIATSEILVSSLDLVASHDIDIVAPQRGSLFGKELLPLVIKELKTIDCGIAGYKKEAEKSKK